MHGDCHTLFLRYYELKQEFTVEHVPELDYTILTAASDRVILIELMKALCLLNLELAGRYVFEVTSSDSEARRVAGLQLERGIFCPRYEPHGTRRGSHDALSNCLVIASRLRETINRKLSLLVQEERMGATFVKISLPLRPTMNLSIVLPFYNDLGQTSIDLPD